MSKVRWNQFCASVASLKNALVRGKCNNVIKLLVSKLAVLFAEKIYNLHYREEP